MTKDELLKEQEKLKARNEELLAELRELKSQQTYYDARKNIVEDYDKKVAEIGSLKQEMLAKDKQLSFQDRQINVLINGLNNINISISKFFDNMEYMLSLAKENYNKTFNNIQTELNNIIPKEEDK